MAIAAWVGMFATALNLLPGGQLDGGHIVYSMSPRLHKWVSRATVVVLIPIGLLLWTGWLLWAVLLVLSGMRHPQIGPAYRSLLGYGTDPGNAPEHDPTRSLGRARIVLAVLAAVMLALTFMPMPIQDAGILRPYVEHWLSR
jgi:membrane-associated protease RseP (regulator of RpoE activity)